MTHTHFQYILKQAVCIAFNLKKLYVPEDDPVAIETCWAKNCNIIVSVVIKRY